MLTEPPNDHKVLLKLATVSIPDINYRSKNLFMEKLPIPKWTESNDYKVFKTLATGFYSIPDINSPPLLRTRQRRPPLNVSASAWVRPVSARSSTYVSR